MIEKVSVGARKLEDQTMLSHLLASANLMMSQMAHVTSIGCCATHGLTSGEKVVISDCAEMRKDLLMAPATCVTMPQSQS